MTTPVGLGVKLPFSTPEEFLERYGTNLTRGGIWLRTRVLHPPGTLLALEIRLKDGAALLKIDRAEVAFVTGHRGEGVMGMGIRFLQVEELTRRFLDSVAAAIPHARSDEPPLPPNVGQPDRSPNAVLPPAPPSAHAPATLPSAAAGRVVVQGGGQDLQAPAFDEPTEPPRQEGPVIGIDLGTTNSCAAFVLEGRPQVIRSREGYNTVPSIVALNSRSRLVVGHPAKSQLLTNPRLTVYGSKRMVGRGYDTPAVQDMKDRFPWEVCAAPNGDAAAKLGDRVYPLTQISALILREVKALAEHQLARPVSRAVITVPAWYSENQRQAVREAGRLAGFHVERIVNEPTAAALAYGYDKAVRQKVLVYDLGGGTFDASVLELHEGVYEVVSTGGDTFLGGLDFDTAIVQWLLARFHAQHGVEFRGDRVAMQRLFDASERAKHALSEAQEARLHVPFATMIADKPVDVDFTLTRDELSELTRPLVERTLKTVDEVLGARGLKPQDVDAVLLVGGQSRAPLVRQALEQYFGKPPVRSVNPDEAVAQGAALLARSLERKEGLVLIDVLPMSIGVGLAGGRFLTVIPRNSPLPARRQYVRATTRDDQTDLVLELFQGENPRARENEYLGSVRFEGLPKGPKGAVKVELTFELSNECLLKVSAREPVSGLYVERSVVTRDTPQAVRERLMDPDPPYPKPTGVFAWLKRLFGL